MNNHSDWRRLFQDHRVLIPVIGLPLAQCPPEDDDYCQAVVKAFFLPRTWLLDTEQSVLAGDCMTRLSNARISNHEPIIGCPKRRGERLVT